MGKDLPFSLNDLVENNPDPNVGCQICDRRTSLLPHEQAAEDNLVKGMKRNDSASWRAFDVQRRPEIQRIVKQYISRIASSEEIEDVVQNVFITIYKNIGTFRGNSKLMVWVFTICRNLSYAFIRKRRGRREIFYTDTLTSIPPDDRDYSTPDPEAAVVCQDTARALTSTLSGEKFNTLKLACQGYSSKEIADEFTIPAATARTRLHHARLGVRAYMAKHYPELLVHLPPNGLSDTEDNE